MLRYKSTLVVHFRSWGPDLQVLNVQTYFSNKRWHILRAKGLESWTSSTKRNLAFGSSKWRWFWLLWAFGILWTDQKRLHLPMQIPKYWRSTKGPSKRPCSSPASTWWTINLGDDSVVEAIGIGPILLELKQKAKYIKFTSLMCFTCQSCKQFALSEQAFVEQVEGAFSHNKCIMGGANGNVVAIPQRRGNMYHMVVAERMGPTSCVHV